LRVKMHFGVLYAEQLVGPHQCCLDDYRENLVET
jgi:hypothetical protein